MYVTPGDKLDFIVETTKQTKADLVAEEGLGEVAPLTMFAWKDDMIEVIAQTARVLDRYPQKRFETMVKTAFAIRKGWGVTSFTIAVEGYRSIEPSESPADLAERFAAGDQTVEEVLIACHVEPFGAVLSTLPYTYALGRKVVFGESNYEPVGEAAYTSAIRSALTVDPDFEPPFEIEGVSLWVRES